MLHTIDILQKNRGSRFMKPAAFIFWDKVLLSLAAALKYIICIYYDYMYLHHENNAETLNYD